MSLFYFPHQISDTSKLSKKTLLCTEYEQTKRSLFIFRTKLGTTLICILKYSKTKLCRFIFRTKLGTPFISHKKCFI